MRCIGDKKTHAREFNDLRWHRGPCWCYRHLHAKRTGPAKRFAHVSLYAVTVACDLYSFFGFFLNFSNIYVIKLKCSSKKNTSKVICQNSENINTHAVPTSSCKMNEGKKICSIVFGVQ